MDRSPAAVSGGPADRSSDIALARTQQRLDAEWPQLTAGLQSLYVFSRRENGRLAKRSGLVVRL
jgi:hypothetical protein